MENLGFDNGKYLQTQSAHIRRRLEEILEQELGIAKEKQLWTG